jgi:hypothetical protein
MNMREAAVKAWVGIWYVVYVVFRVLLRLLIGKHRRDWVQYVMGLHYSRDYSFRMVVYSHAMSLTCTG